MPCPTQGPFLKPVCRPEGPWRGVKTPSGCQGLFIDLDQMQPRVELTSPELTTFPNHGQSLNPKHTQAPTFVCLSRKYYSRLQTLSLPQRFAAPEAASEILREMRLLELCPVTEVGLAPKDLRELGGGPLGLS